MKKIYLLVFSLFFLTACDENEPVVPCLSCDDGEMVVLEVEDKRILIEEYTGVRCVNCPAGSSEIENLRSVYGDQLIVVSIHAGDFAFPYSDGEDFRTTSGNDLLSFLGEPIGYPSAVIDRKTYSNSQEGLPLVGVSSWAGPIQEQAAQKAIVGLSIEHTYDATSRQLNVTVDISPVQDITENTNITILLTENNIINQQSSPAPVGIIDDYSHKHVLRDALTNAIGDAITEELLEGAMIQKTYTYTVSEAWIAENCSIVAFISNNGTTKAILQAAEAHLVE